MKKDVLEAKYINTLVLFSLNTSSSQQNHFKNQKSIHALINS